MTTAQTIGLDSLRFFTGDGREIPMSKQYSISWEIIPANEIRSAFIKNPTGHFELSPDNDLSGIEYIENIESGYKTSQKIIVKKDYSYEITAYGTSCRLYLYDKDDNEISISEFSETKNLDEYTYTLTSDKFPDIYTFSVKSIISTNQIPIIIEKANFISSVVDEYGKIRSYVTFPAKDCDNQYIYNPAQTTDSSDISNSYERIDKSIKYINITDVFEILFFSYRYDRTLEITKGCPQTTTEYINNTIHIVINNGTESAEQDFNLLNILRTNKNLISNKDNIITYKSWDPERDPLLNIDENSLTEEDKKRIYLYGFKTDIYNEYKLTDIYDFRKTRIQNINGYQRIYKNDILIDQSTDTNKNYELDFTDDENTQTPGYYLLHSYVGPEQYPYVKYIGNVFQDKISTNFVASTTIIIVKDNGISSSGERYTYPDIKDGDSNSEYMIHFIFEKDSEMYFINTDDVMNMVKSDSMFSLRKSETTNETAIHFAVGFQTDTEGCYVNMMGMFIRDNNNSDAFIGGIRFMTEAEDEDERFRTLFMNFGIPDPIKYPNIFKEQDPAEDGTDWTLINKKSKELFLYYDQIFPYVGTYKALFNSIKFLGYQDIIFKEWYKIKDKNDKNKYVAIQNYNTSTGESISNSLKKYGIDFGEYDRYTKLNRLSMIYHLQQIDDDNSEQQLKPITLQDYYIATIGKVHIFFMNINTTGSVYDLSDRKTGISSVWDDIKIGITETGKVKIISGSYVNEDNITVDMSNGTYYLSNNIHFNDFTNRDSVKYPSLYFITNVSNALTAEHISNSGSSSISYYNSEDISAIKEIYEYRTDEVLSKLYSVKNWIETYITGVNCYISDINGECIVLERMKTTGYVTSHEFKDIQNEGLFTPNCKQITDFNDSSAIIRCSLNEFCYDSSALRFEDYKDYPFERFVKKEYQVSLSETGKTLSIYDSAPFGAMTVADEYQFTLKLDDAVSGSLYEFSSETDKDNPILISDGEIKFWDQKKSISRIESSELPIISIRQGNIRKPYDNWAGEKISDTNVLYAIYPATDAKGNTYTVIKKPVDTSESGGSSLDKCSKGEIILSPANMINSEIQSEFIYTSENKWKLPMFFFKGYKWTNPYSSDFTYNASTNVTMIYDRKYPNTPIEFNSDYIIEIIEGDIKFNNKTFEIGAKNCKSAEIYFTMSQREELSGEQIIGINYRYMSDRVPIYTFDNKKTNFKNEKECFDYLRTNETTLNTYIDIPVNRTGTYKVQVNAFDSYNNIFTNTDDDICTIGTKEPSIDIITNYPSSRNSKDFYRYNTSTNKMTDLEKSELFSVIEPEPIFPIDYKIYDFEHDSSAHVISYDNISYALDTPKINDYMLMTNLTEQVYDITLKTGSTYRLNMKSSNMQKQNIYVKEGYVNLCVYDDNRKIILYKTDEPIKCTSTSAPTSSDMTNRLYGNGYIELNIIDSSLKSYINEINSSVNNINMYVINATELSIDTSTSEIINYIDSSTRMAFIKLENEKTVDAAEKAEYFNKDTMIKISMFLNSSEGKHIDISETAYRIIDISTRTTDTTTETGYVIDGNIDFSYINKLHNTNLYKNGGFAKNTNTYIYNPQDISVVMKPLNTEPVEYSLRVTNDALETVYVYGDYDYYSINTDVSYNSKQLMFNSYFDDSYSGYVMSYNPASLSEIWSIDSSTIYDSSTSDLYLYRNYPVTIPQNKNVIVKPGSDIKQLEGNFMKLWKWKSFFIEDNSNWPEREHNMQKSVLFESINNIISIKPYILGSQNIELYCTDKYGNCIKNIDGGNLYVVSEDDELTPSTLKVYKDITGNWNSDINFYYTYIDETNVKQTINSYVNTFNFTSDYEGSSHGTGIILIEYSEGPISTLYRKFIWDIDKNGKLTIIFNKNEYPSDINEFEYGYGFIEVIEDERDFYNITDCQIDWNTYTSDFGYTKRD